MTQEKTIKDVLEALHDAMQKALPDMDVYINIQVGPKKVITEPAGEPTKGPTKEPTETDLECLKATLNGYVKAVGKTRAFELVKEFAGSENPADIPPEKYNEMFNRMKEEGVDRINVNLSKKDKEAT